MIGQNEHKFLKRLTRMVRLRDSELPVQSVWLLQFDFGHYFIEFVNITRERNTFWTVFASDNNASNQIRCYVLTTQPNSSHRARAMLSFSYQTPVVCNENSFCGINGVRSVGSGNLARRMTHHAVWLDVPRLQKVDETYLQCGTQRLCIFRIIKIAEGFRFQEFIYVIN